MAQTHQPRELAEHIALLFQELGVTADLIRDGLQPPVIALKSGRSPVAIRLEEQLAEIQSYRIIIEEVLAELGQRLQDFSRLGAPEAPDPESKAVSEMLNAAPQLERERRTWQAYLEELNRLLKHLQLIQGESQLSALGRRPIEEAWEKLEAVINHT